MPNPNPKTAHLKPVRTTEEARALAARAQNPGRPRSERALKPWAGKLYADQLEALDALGVKKSELLRELIDEYLSKRQ